MSRQHIDYTTSANTPPNAPADDGLDTGEKVNTSLRPVADGEPAQEAVLARPTENLRTRTEIVRDELESLKYLSDSDRGMLLTSTGDITWNGVGTGTFVASANLILKPFTAPDVSSASRLIICAGTASQVTIRTRQDGVSGQPRAYSGANDISFDFQLVDTGLGNVVITTTGTPANNFHVQIDNNAISGTTVTQLLTALNGNTTFATTWGLEAVVDGGTVGGSPAEVGFPTPPAPVVGNRVYLSISGPEQLTRFMAGAADAEKHIITPTHLSNFFVADGGTLNKLIEGDVLCLRYDDLVMALDGGRRQSVNETPENKAIVAGANLFLMRRFPERLPGALPIAAVVNGQLIFVNGRVYGSGEIGPLVSSGSSYQGSAADFADTTSLAAGSFESVLDALVLLLGKKTTTVGAAKIGIDALTGTTFSTSAGSVRSSINDVLTGANAHINLGTAAHAATAVSNTANTGGSYPGNRVSATTVQAAINELDAEKAAIGAVNTFTATQTITAASTTALVITPKADAPPIAAIALGQMDIALYQPGFGATAASGSRVRTGMGNSYRSGTMGILTLANPWAGSDSHLIYWMDTEGVVHIRGNLVCNSPVTVADTGFATVSATIPAGFRPMAFPSIPGTATGMQPTGVCLIWDTGVQFPAFITTSSSGAILINNRTGASRDITYVWGVSLDYPTWEYGA